MSTKPTPAQVAEFGFRKAVPPEPKVYAACRNCKHFVYDADDRMTLAGVLTFRRVNLRCRPTPFKVQLETVCDRHDFKWADRKDA